MRRRGALPLPVRDLPGLACSAGYLRCSGGTSPHRAEVALRGFCPGLGLVLNCCPLWVSRRETPTTPFCPPPHRGRGSPCSRVSRASPTVAAQAGCASSLSSTATGSGVARRSACAWHSPARVPSSQTTRPAARPTRTQAGRSVGVGQGPSAFLNDHYCVMTIGKPLGGVR